MDRAGRLLVVDGGNHLVQVVNFVHQAECLPLLSSIMRVIGLFNCVCVQPFTFLIFLHDSKTGGSPKLHTLTLCISMQY